MSLTTFQEGGEDQTIKPEALVPPQLMWGEVRGANIPSVFSKIHHESSHSPGAFLSLGLDTFF